MGKAKDELEGPKGPLNSKALIIAMKVYDYLSETAQTVDTIRYSHKCSSPSHTALGMKLYAMRDDIASMVFAMSGYDYNLLEDMKTECEGCVVDFNAVLEKNGYCHEKGL